MTFKEDKDPINKSLLPSGLRDQLPPHAAHEAAIVEGLINTCELSGYERVKPHSLNMRTPYFQALVKPWFTALLGLWTPFRKKCLVFDLI